MSYTITFKYPDNDRDPDNDREYSMQCDAYTTLLDASIEANQRTGFFDGFVDRFTKEGFEKWPNEGGNGALHSTAALLISGEVDQSDQTCLSDAQIEAGYILTDVAYPQSDCSILLGQEDACMDFY
ncbi:ferredoxin-1 [Penicillium brevicompactum]|uniref:Ferredoxin-1 n=1 Tax=Penicillium brevicompactum TaxID=5074 RepID=A0A9W9R2A5_PENBR|nr:ferredoxin-1 [Penicillium brevicompactum]